MEHQGYIKLYRKLLENPISYNIELLGFLSYLLLEVNHTEQEIYRGNQKIKLSPGERIISQRQLAERFSISISKVHRFIKILEEEGILEHQGSSSFTIVKLLNWDTYNGIETQKEHEKKAKRTREETKQEGIQGEEGKEYNTIVLQQADDDIEIIEKKEYGNTEINKLLEYIKQKVGCDTFAESQILQRRYAKHLLSLGNKIGPEEFNKRLESILDDKFKLKNSNKIAFLYKELKSFISVPEKEIAKF